MHVIRVSNLKVIKHHHDNQESTFCLGQTRSSFSKEKNNIRGPTNKIPVSWGLALICETNVRSCKCETNIWLVCETNTRSCQSYMESEVWPLWDQNAVRLIQVQCEVHQYESMWNLANTRPICGLGPVNARPMLGLVNMKPIWTRFSQCRPRWGLDNARSIWTLTNLLPNMWSCQSET